MGISFNTRTETISQGRVFRLCRTKNKSGSICSVIYLVYLKHATGPTFLNLWTRIKWSPETRTENPHRDRVQTTKKDAFFTLCDTLPHVFTETPLTDPLPLIFQAQIWSSSTQPWDLITSAQKGSSTPSRIPPTTTDLLRFGMCIQEALILGNN